MLLDEGIDRGGRMGTSFLFRFSSFAVMDWLQYNMFPCFYFSTKTDAFNVMIIQSSSIWRLQFAVPSQQLINLFLMS